MDSDDDDFLYGGAPAPTAVPVVPTQPTAPAGTTTPVLQQPTPVEATPSGTVVSRLEDDAEVAVQLEEEGYEDDRPPDEQPMQEDTQQDEEQADDQEEEDDDESDDDIEIIMEQPVRSIDHRPHIPGARPLVQRTTNVPAARGAQPSLTTEYTPISRAGPAPATTATTTVAPAVPTPSAQSQTPAPQSGPETTAPTPALTTEPTATVVPSVPQYDGPDASTLPPVTAPPSHPTIDPTITATLDGRSVLDVDLDAMTESGKAWRRPGSDLSDWFNYGFDELSWEAYCYRRRDLGEMGGVLKANLITFSGMPEEQISALPADLRQMVMTGSTALNGNMINPMGMMDMSGMNPMNGMNPMMMNGMGEMGMQQMMMQQQQQQQFQEGGNGVGGVAADGTPEQGQMMDGGYPMGMGMEYGPGGGGGVVGMDGPQNQMNAQQQMYQQQQQQQQQQIQTVGGEITAPSANSSPLPPVAPANRGATGRGRGAGAGRGIRGAGFPPRGRGRGGAAAVGSTIVRPTSPLPPNVPTGPRNQNKYKDRDGNAPAVDGLDYGGGAGNGGSNKDRDGRTPSREPEERSSSSRRKRRSSPGLDESSSRSSKRR